MLKKDRFFISVTSTLAASIVIMLFGLVAGSLTARLLGVAGRGELASIQLYGSLFASICTSGLPAAVTYFTGIENDRAGVYLVTGTATALLIAVPCTIIGFITIPHLLESQRPEVVLASRFYLVFIPLAIVTAFSLASLQGQMKMLLWNMLRVVASVFWLVPLAILFYFRVNDSILVSKIYLLFLFFYSCIFITFLLQNIHSRLEFDKKSLKSLWSYALPTSFAVFSQQSNLKLDQVFIAAMLPPEMLGIYAVSIAWSAAHSPLTGAVSYVVVPHLAQLDSLANQSSAINRIIRTTILINLVLTACMFVVTPMAIRLLFGSGFSGAIPISIILIAGSMFSNVKVVISEGLRGMRMPKIVMRGEILGLAISLILFPLLLLVFGLAGVAVASAIAHVATFSYMVARLKSHSGVLAKEILLPRREDIAYLFLRISDLVSRNK